MKAERIIHKSKYRCIVNDFDKHQRKRKIEKAQHSVQGLKAPKDKPFMPMGRLSNILYVLDSVKKRIPHSNSLGKQTEKVLKNMKEQKHPCLFGKKPNRTLKILNSEESDSDDESFFKSRSKMDEEMRRRSNELLAGKSRKCCIPISRHKTKQACCIWFGQRGQW